MLQEMCFISQVNFPHYEKIPITPEAGRYVGPLSLRASFSLLFPESEPSGLHRYEECSHENNKDRNRYP